MDEDILCIERFLSGDAGGFTMLVRKYQNRVLNIVYSLIGKDGESEDISQEVFLKIYHSLSSFRQNCRFSTWLYRVAVNTTYDFLRKRKNLVNDEIAIENSISSYDGPDEVLAKKEEKTMLEKVLAGTPLEYRAALVLKDVEGLNYKQIAEILGCGMGTVASKIYRGREFLKEELLKLKEGQR